MYTQHEVTYLFARLANQPDIWDHIGLLSDEYVDWLRQVAQNASAHPEDVFRIYTGTLLNPPDEAELERRHAQDRKATYWAARRLREYFFPGEPMPVFEPIKEIGTIKETVEIAQEIVSFGDLHSWLMRAHPVILARPDGCKLITRFVREQHFRREVDVRSDNQFVRQYGQHGIVWGEPIRLVDDVPAGTVCYVDRSSVADIEPL